MLLDIMLSPIMVTSALHFYSRQCLFHLTIGGQPSLEYPNLLDRDRINQSTAIPTYFPTKYTPPQYNTPLVLMTSPSLPCILVVAILIATANALNALSALW